MLEERDWKILLTRIKTGKCTPFLGAAVNVGILPLGDEIATEWARSEHYPLDSCSDLAKVSQFIAVQMDPSYPKDMMVTELNKSQKPFDFNDPDEPLNVLAKLPLSVYLTTNYDDLLFHAINHHGNATGRRAAREICRWNDDFKNVPLLFGPDSKFMASPQTPVVYHLHGHRSVVDSLVLTEDDYLDYLVNMSAATSRGSDSLEKPPFLPPRIEEAITGSSLMFVGYSLADINFRVLFRGLRGNLAASLKKLSVAVQLPYKDAHPNKQKAEEYVTEYFRKMAGTESRVYWGTARSFAQQLWERWEKFSD